MAQTGFTPILTYASNTATSVPAAGNLTNSTNGSELAVNTADKRLFTKDSGGNVVEVGTNPSAITVAGTTTLSALTASTALALNSSKQVVSVTNTGTGNNVLADSPTLTGTIGAAAATLSGNLTLSAGTANGVTYLNGSKVLTSGSALTFDGTDLATTGGVRLNNAQYYYGKNAAGSAVRLLGVNAGNVNYVGSIDSGPTEVNYGAASTITAQYWNISGSEQMRLTSTGLGIGTSSPGSKLEVAGQTVVKFANPDVSGIVLQATTGTNAAGMKFTNTGGNGFVGLDSSTGTRIGGAAYSLSVWHEGAYPITFGTNNTLRATLDSSGNLGLGVQPSAWNSDYKAFNFGASGFVYGRVGSQETAIGTNWLRNSGASFVYAANGFASYYAQTSGIHSWHIAPNNTSGAGATASFTQAMTLDASGNLALGGTTNKVTGVTGSGSGFTVQASGAPTLAIWDTSDASYYTNITQINELLYLWNIANGAMSFGTNNIERARITSGGNLLVGETSDYLSTRLLVDSAGTDNSTNILTLRNSANTDYFRVRSDGYTYAQGVYDNTTGSAANVFVGSGGDLLRSTSSLRYKTDVQDATHGLAEIMQLRPVTYKGINDGDKVFGGLIAEEVHAAGLTEFVSYDDQDRPDALHYGNMVALLTKAIQELKAELDAYKASHP